MEASWISGLIGGALLGGASLLALSASGKVPGVSGVFEKAIFPQGDASWRWLFLLGLVVGATFVFRIVPSSSAYSPVEPLWIHAAAGLLVGFGSRLGGGCTSGHGICGIGMGARDSIVATLVFMATAALVVWLR